MKPTRNPFVLARVSTLAAFFLACTGVHAVGVWVGTTGNFDVAANWDTAVVPASVNTNVSNGGTIQVTTNHTTNDILAATNASSTGTWSQSAGALTMAGGWFRLGTAAGASGTFNLSGGTLTTVGNIDIGENSGTTAGNSAVNVSGGTWTNNGAQLTVGGQSSGLAGIGRGTLSLSGTGAIVNNNELWISQNAGSVGVFNLSGGTITQVGWLAVGRNNGTGTMNMTGGTFNKTVANTNATIIGASGVGVLNQVAGALNVANGDTWVGETKAGTWNVSGGTANLLALNVGQNAGGTGILNLQNASSGLTGALTNGGGTEVITAGAMLIGNNATANGTVNLDGGTLAVNTVGRSAGTGTFNFNGGKLQARIATTTFVNNLTRANVRNGGVLIDSQANNITVTQPLLHSNIGGDAATDGGLTKMGTGNLLVSGINTYTGTTTINAGGFGFASTTAQTWGGLITGAGSLLQAGTGAITLPNANTFTGNVSVTVGSLIVSNSSALGSGTKTVDISNGTAGNIQLHLNGSAGSVNLPASFTYNASNTAGTIFNDAGTNSIAGQINMNVGGGGTTIQSDAGSLTVSANITAVTTGRALTLQGASSGTVSGIISNGSTAGLPLNKNGAGTWVVSGLNTFSGLISVNAGTLQAGSAQSGSSGAFGNNAPVTLANTAGALLDLNGLSNSIGSLAGGGAAGGNVNLGSAYLTVGGLSTATTYGGVVGGSGGLVKTGSNTLTLTNASTYTGATTVNAGTLLLDHSGANLGALGESAVTVGASGTLKVKGNANVGLTSAGSLASSGTLNLQDTAINTLTLGGALSLSDSLLSIDLGGNGVTGTVDQVISTGAATVAGTNTINLNLVTGQTITAGSYTLITAPGGLGSGGAGFSIGTTPAGFYNYSLVASTPSAVVLTITGNATSPVAYWTGRGSALESDGANRWAGGGTVSVSNWSNTVNGAADPLQVPGAVTDVYFTAANGSPGAGGILDTVLDANYSIKSLTFDTSPQTLTPISGVVISTDVYSLTVGSGGLTVAATDNSSTTVSGTGPISLQSSQTWANNNSSQPLTVNTSVSGFTGAISLALGGSGSGGVTLGGVISNGTATSVGLVLGQAGITALNANNTFTGGVTLASGTVKLGNAGALNSATPNTLTFSAGSTGDLQLNGNSITVNSLATDAIAGTPVIENAGASTAILTDTIATGGSTFAGVLQDGSGGGALALTKAGAGGLALTNQNTYTGATNINAGILNLGAAENVGIAGPLGNFGLISFGGGILQYSAANQFDYSSRFSTAATQQFKIDTNGQTVGLTTNLTSTGGNIHKYGTGVLTLSGAASAVGNVFTHAGVLVLDTAASITTTGYCSFSVQPGDNSIVTAGGASKLLVTGDFNVSDLTGSNGVLNIADTATVKGTALYVGKSGTATGTVNQTGGNISPTAGGADWRIGGAGGTGDAAAVGIYNISGGTFTTAVNFQIGAYGNGAMNVSNTGAVATTGGFTVVGRFTGSYGVLDVDGGSFGQNATGPALIIGEQGTGIMNVRAGVVTAMGTNGTNGLYIGGTEATAGTVGIVNLDGGTLVAPKILTGSVADSSTLNFNGGMLKANGASTTYLTGLTAAYVYSGGANIDADGRAITIGQALLTPAGSSGVQSISVTDGGSGYSTTPIVKITGGGGVGATAVATMSGGLITGIVVTNPGIGYTSPPSVTLVNGLTGGTGAAFSPALAVNTSGALSVSSTTAGGVVTLTGVSTFTGNTTINTGATLQLGSGATGADGTIPSATIVDNGTLSFNRFGTLSDAVLITGSGGVNKAGAGTQILTALNTYTGATTINGGVLSVGVIGNGGTNSNIGAATAAPTNIVFGGNGTLLYTGTSLVTDRGFTVGVGGGIIDHASDMTFGGQIQSNSTGSFTKNGTGTLSFTNTNGTNSLVGGGAGNGLGFIVNNGLVVLGGTPAAPLAQTNVIIGEVSIGTINSATSPAAEIDINGGTTTVSSYIGVGRGNGTNNATTTLTLRNNAVVSSGNFAIGYSNGVAGYTSSPTVNFNATSSYTDTGVFTVGESGNGVGGVSTVNVNGSASVSLTSVSATAVNIGAGGAAVLNQNGGSVTSAATVTLARDAASTATYHLNGGSLNVPALAKGLGTATFNFNGGTLGAAASSVTFMQGITRANVRNGGAIINTGSYNVTAAQALVHSDVGGDAAIDGGLTKEGAGTLTLAFMNSYTGDTTVAGGTLELQSNGSLNDAASVKLVSGVALKLSFSGTDTVSSLFIDGAEQAPGIWGRIGSGAAHESALITGDGLLQVVNGVTVAPFDTWAATHGLTGADALAGADPDHDGYNNLAEFILGGEPNPANAGANSNALAPTVAASGGSHVFSFRRSELALTQPGLVIGYEYGSSLTGWSPAVNGVDGITITVTPGGYGSGIDRVDVSIPDALAPVGTRFARLHATQP